MKFQNSENDIAYNSMNYYPPNLYLKNNFKNRNTNFIPYLNNINNEQLNNMIGNNSIIFLYQIIPNDYNLINFQERVMPNNVTLFKVKLVQSKSNIF